MRAWFSYSHRPADEFSRMLREYNKAKAEWKKWHPDGAFTPADPPPDAPSRVSYNSRGISILVNGHEDTPYHLTWSKTDSFGKIIGWARVFSKRPWGNRYVIYDFIELTLSRMWEKIVDDAKKEVTK